MNIPGNRRHNPSAHQLDGIGLQTEKGTRSFPLPVQQINLPSVQLLTPKAHHPSINGHPFIYSTVVWGRLPKALKLLSTRSFNAYLLEVLYTTILTLIHRNCAKTDSQPNGVVTHREVREPLSSRFYAVKTHLYALVCKEILHSHHVIVTLTSAARWCKVNGRLGLTRGTRNGGPRRVVRHQIQGHASPGCIRTCRPARGEGVTPCARWGYRSNQEGVGVCGPMLPLYTQLRYLPTLLKILEVVRPEREGGYED